MNKLINPSVLEPGRIIIIGAGNWGTTLALILARHRETILWTRDSNSAENINEKRENFRYLEGIRLPVELTVEAFGASEIAPEDIVLIAVPSHQVRNVSEKLSGSLQGQVVVNTAKGFEHHTMKTLTQVLDDTLPISPKVVWSGPNIAREMADGKPTRAVLASRDMSVLSRCARMLRNDVVSFEISRDIRGVELCASLKGLLAITIGVSDGLELGDNFIGLLVSYGLREFIAIAEFMGIPRDTIYGIAGLGDCLTSSLSPHGRNRRFGRLIGEGIHPEKAVDQVGMVVEGVQMLRTITELEDLNIPLPIFSAVKRMVFNPNGDVRKLLVDTVMKYQTWAPQHRITVGEVA